MLKSRVEPLTNGFLIQYSTNELFKQIGFNIKKRLKINNRNHSKRVYLDLAVELDKYFIKNNDRVFLIKKIFLIKFIRMKH